MPNPDPYLKLGLTPSTDVELYASEAAGGYTKAGTGIAQAVGSGTKTVTSDRTGTGIANGVAAGGSDITYTKTGVGIAQAAGSGVQSVTGSSTTYVKAGTGVAEVSASGSQTTTATPADTGVGGGRYWSPAFAVERPRPPITYAKTGTGVALAHGSGSSDTANPSRARRHQLLLVGAI